MKLRSKLISPEIKNCFVVFGFCVFFCLVFNKTFFLSSLFPVRGYFQVTVIFLKVSSLIRWLKLLDYVMYCATV